MLVAEEPTLRHLSWTAFRALGSLKTILIGYQPSFFVGNLKEVINVVGYSTIILALSFMTQSFFCSGLKAIMAG